jgi:protein-S-isoprenylcysteine O-methyltransferase Ste14
VPAEAETTGRDSPGVLAPPPLIYLAGLGAGLLLDALLSSASLPAAVRWPVGALLVVGGFSLMATFVGAFRRAQTNVDPWKPTTAIVTDGPYRFTRNPGYLGMAVVFGGIAVLADAPWAFLLLPPTAAVIDRGVIAREERYLEGKFGEEYLAYKARARRWL